VSFYLSTSKKDRHTDVLDIICNLDERETAEMEAKKNKETQVDF
jgi:hypothetical protein